MDSTRRRDERRERVEYESPEVVVRRRLRAGETIDEITDDLVRKAVSPRYDFYDVIPDVVNVRAECGDEVMRRLLVDLPEFLPEGYVFTKLVEAAGYFPGSWRIPMAAPEQRALLLENLPLYQRLKNSLDLHCFPRIIMHRTNEVVLRPQAEWMSARIQAELQAFIDCGEDSHNAAEYLPMQQELYVSTELPRNRTQSFLRILADMPHTVGSGVLLPNRTEDQYIQWKISPEDIMRQIIAYSDCTK